ncbi:hypothetical protein LTR92_002160 [Exophiala xenobiotica]|nr:hypothetical protein LTR92_002160 [Exophiala xenobiotica]KAK5451035.1 hypothetical protein LTR18_001051 [Exophiala xenobiotica]
MESVKTSSVEHRPSHDHACVRCAERKVKCDRRQPCEACMRHNADCIFRPLPPRKKRKKLTKEEILLGRIKLYESLLEDNGVDPRALAGSPVARAPLQNEDHVNTSTSETPQLPTPDSTVFSPAGAISKPRLLHGQGRYHFLDNGLWTRVMEELHESVDALGDSSDDTSEQDEIIQNVADIVLGPINMPGSLDNLHPHPDQILALWQIYLKNVNPIMKLIHAPTTEKAIQHAASDPKEVSKSVEALLFAIYSVAIMSMQDKDCEQQFDQPRKALLSRYVRATKLALSRANLMGTSNIVVLQAFLLHLASVRDFYDSRTLWNMLGVATRIAEGMGMHRDGSTLGLPPFDSEIRRRIWWEMSLLDQKSGDLTGQTKFGAFDGDTKIPQCPANVDDHELFPAMTLPPEESKKVTDSLYCAMRADLFTYWSDYAARRRKEGMSGNLLGNHANGGDLKDKDQAIEEFGRMLESKYVRYLDPSQPLQFLSMLVARAVVSKARFMVHHPKRWNDTRNIPVSERENVWSLSIKLLQQYNMVRSSPYLQRFSWYTTYYFPWQTFIHILDTMRLNPLMAEGSEVWQLIEETYRSFPNLITKTRELPCVAISNLCLKAYFAYTVALMKDGKPVARTPDFIGILRRQREQARGFRAEQETKGMISLQAVASPQQRDLQRPSQDTSPRQVCDNQAQMSIDDPTLWSTGDVNGNLQTTSTNVPRASGSFECSPGNEIDIFADQAIDWSQWDMLLGDPSLMPMPLMTDFPQ